MKVRKFSPLLIGAMMLSLYGCAAIIGIGAGPEHDTKTGLLEIDKPIEIVRDDRGIPHIYAETEEDIYFAVGWVSAEDRLFQMELLRRVSSGRLSEIIGDVPTQNERSYWKSMLQRDMLHRVIGFKDYGDRAASVLPEEDLKLLQKYCDGVNSFVKNYPEQLPWEFDKIDLVYEPWEPADVIALSRYFGWALSWDWSSELVWASLAERFGVEKADELFPPRDDWGPTVIEADEQKFDFGGAKQGAGLAPEYRGVGEILKFVRGAGYPGISGSYTASNSWVISGIKTKSGRPIMSNDPHLLMTLPSVWYAAHIHGAGYDVAGVFFPGTPNVILGHSKNVAWGATTPLADVQDIFIEKPNPDNPKQYMTAAGPKDFGVRTEKFLYKKDGEMEEVDISVLSTGHGPIINSVFPQPPTDGTLLALSWTGFDFRNEFRAFRNMARAQNGEEFVKAFEDYGVPVQNWVWADTEGNIGYLAGGNIPIRKKGDGSRPVPGWTGEYDWVGSIPLAELPQIVNPAKGFVATANNRVVDRTAYPHQFATRYVAGYRAKTITSSLSRFDNWSVDSVMTLQHEDINSRAERLLPIIISESKELELGDFERKMIGQLEAWDLKDSADKPAPLIFADLTNSIKEEMYLDEMDIELYDSLRRQPALVQIVDNYFVAGEGGPIDYADTPEKEGRKELLARSIKRTYDRLSDVYGDDPIDWRWGKSHTLTLAHPFAAVWPLNLLLKFGPYPVDGGSWDVLAFQYETWLKPYQVYSGPSMRHVVDMSAPEDGKLIYPGGQSGWGRSPHFTDMIEPYLRGEIFTIPMKREEVDKAARKVELLSPEIFEPEDKK